MREHPLFAATFGAIARFKAVLIPRVAVISRVSVQNLDAIYHENVIVFLAKPNSSSWWIFDRYRDRLRLDAGEVLDFRAETVGFVVVLDPCPRATILSRVKTDDSSVAKGSTAHPVADLDCVVHHALPSLFPLPLHVGQGVGIGSSWSSAHSQFSLSR